MSKLSIRVTVDAGPRKTVEVHCATCEARWPMHLTHVNEAEVDEAFLLAVAEQDHDEYVCAEVRR
jgi:hypothetical protein